MEYSFCVFVKLGSRFSYRPEEWGQRVCYQKSCHEQSLECAASLGLQTLTGIVHFTFVGYLSVFLRLYRKIQQHLYNDIVVVSVLRTLS